MMPEIDNTVRRQALLRLRLSWLGPLIWVAHLDRMRALERAMLRAEWPLFYSQGYNPRPQFVFALPSSVGIASYAEYVDVSLQECEESSLAALIENLQKQLPDGITIVDWASLNPEDSTTSMAQVRMCDYEFSYPGISAAFKRLFERDEILVTKFSKGKKREEECKRFLVHADYPEENTARLQLMAGSMNNLRADLLLEALAMYENFAHVYDVTITKKELWLKKDKSHSYLSPAIPGAPGDIVPWEGE